MQSCLQYNTCISNSVLAISFVPMCICICISKWVGVLYEGGAEAIQLYFHREYEQEGHWLTTHVAVNTYKIQIIIITAATNMMATRYTGGGMRC